MSVSSAFLERNSGHCGLIVENIETVKSELDLDFIYMNMLRNNSNPGALYDTEVSHVQIWWVFLLIWVWK